MQCHTECCTEDDQRLQNLGSSSGTQKKKTPLQNLRKTRRDKGGQQRITCCSAFVCISFCLASHFPRFTPELTSLCSIEAYLTIQPLTPPHKQQLETEGALKMLRGKIGISKYFVKLVAWVAILIGGRSS